VGMHYWVYVEAKQRRIKFKYRKYVGTLVGNKEVHIIKKVGPTGARIRQDGAKKKRKK